MRHIIVNKRRARSILIVSILIFLVFDIIVRLIFGPLSGDIILHNFMGLSFGAIWFYTIIRNNLPHNCGYCKTAAWRVEYYPGFYRYFGNKEDALKAAARTPDSDIEPLYIKED